MDTRGENQSFRLSITNKNILIISPEAWGPFWVSKHHYAATLALAHNSIYFLGPEDAAINVETPAGITLLSDPGVISGARFLPDFVAKNSMEKAAKKLEEQAGCEFDFIWSFDTSRYFHLDCFGEDRMRILHLVDPPKSNLKDACESASTCFANTEDLAEEMREYAEKVHLVEHGVALNYPDLPKVKLPGAEGRKKVMYAGNLAHPLLDAMFVAEVVRKCPEVDFIFVGPTGDSNLGDTWPAILAGKIAAYRNAFFVTKLQGAAYPQHLRSADLLFLAYKPSQKPLYPHKTLEYLATGQPVLSLPFVGIAHLDDYLYFEEKENFVAAIHKLLETPNTKRDAQLKFVASASYAQKLQQIEDYIFE